MALKGTGDKRYVITTPDEEVDGLDKRSTITFSFDDWEGSKEPLPNQTVLLSDIVRFKKGWRARTAKPDALF